MTEPKDQQRPRQPAFDRDDAYSGQNYSVDEEHKLASTMPSGSVAAEPSRVGAGEDPVMPPDNGRRASFDPHTGEVRGSGAGAGGGNPGEDMDSDNKGGHGAQVTGATADKGAPDRVEPAQEATDRRPPERGDA